MKLIKRLGNAIARWTRAAPTRSPTASSTMQKRRPQEIHYRLHENPLIKASEIAQRADGTASHLRKILKAHQATERNTPPQGPEAGDGVPAGRGAAPNKKWFERAVEADPAGLRAALEQVLLEGTNLLTSTNLLNPSRVCPITDRVVIARWKPTLFPILLIRQIERK